MGLDQAVGVAKRAPGSAKHVERGASATRHQASQDPARRRGSDDHDDGHDHQHQAKGTAQNSGKSQDRNEGDDNTSDDDREVVTPAVIDDGQRNQGNPEPIEPAGEEARRLMESKAAQTEDRQRDGERSRAAVKNDGGQEERPSRKRVHRLVKPTLMYGLAIDRHVVKQSPATGT